VEAVTIFKVFAEDLREPPTDRAHMLREAEEGPERLALLMALSMAVMVFLLQSPGLLLLAQAVGVERTGMGPREQEAMGGAEMAELRALPEQ
jgi:hypothetical protein